MAGTKAGAVQMWKTRRERYPPNGMKPKSPASGGKRSSQIDKKLPEYVVIDDVKQRIDGYTGDTLRRFKEDTAAMVKQLGQRYRTQPPAKLRGPSGKLEPTPAYIIDAFKAQRSKLQRWVRQRKAAMPILEAYAHKVAMRSRGNRYNR